MHEHLFRHVNVNTSRTHFLDGMAADPDAECARYEEAIAAHLQIGVTACRRLKEEGERLHSRKLRAFNEPPFR